MTDTASRTGSRSATGTRTQASADRGLCVFWLGGKLFGVDVKLVGEVVTVEQTLPVPMAPAYVRGLFNLRGSPVALLELGEVLGIAQPKCDTERPVAVIVRTGDVVVAFAVDAMEAILPSGRGALTEPSEEEHVAVAAFLDLPSGKGVVTVLDAEFVVERIMAARLLKEAS